MASDIAAGPAEAFSEGRRRLERHIGRESRSCHGHREHRKSCKQQPSHRTFSVRGRGRLEGNPGMEEQRVVVLGADRGAIELVVMDVLQADAGVEPWPAKRLAYIEGDVGDL